jgi:toxin YoeB
LRLIEEIKKNPFTGIGKPEPFKGDLKVFWSRRIDGEHRLIYKFEQDVLFIQPCCFHY